MTTHTAHPAISEFGLADNCPRCKQHGERPFDGIDDPILAALVRRTIEPYDEGRSDNERIAMIQIENVGLKASRLHKLGVLDEVVARWPM